MRLTRKEFIGGSAALIGAAAVAGQTAVAGRPSYRVEDYAPLRKQLRAFYPDECHGSNSVEELLDAQKHPERHQNLMVKVCGFSARFVSLSKRFQDEVIARHRLR